MCMEHLKQENAKKRQIEAEESKHQAYKKKLDEMSTEEKSLNEKPEQLKAEQTTAWKAMEKAMSYVENRGQKIHS